MRKYRKNQRLYENKIYNFRVKTIRMIMSVFKTQQKLLSTGKEKP